MSSHMNPTTDQKQKKSNIDSRILIPRFIKAVMLLLRFDNTRQLCSTWVGISVYRQEIFLFNKIKGPICNT